MKRKSIPVIMALLIGLGLLNIMCLILKTVTLSRTCRSIDQAMAQNGHYLLYLCLSILGIVVLNKYQKKESEKSKES